MIVFRIDRLLRAHDWTQYRLEQESGVRRDVIAKYASNQVRRPDLEVLNSLCTALGCGIGELMEFTPDAGARASKTKVKTTKPARSKKR